MVANMNNKKGQATMEFLATYGWAILVVLCAIGVLLYFGVIDPDSFKLETFDSEKHVCEELKCEYINKPFSEYRWSEYPCNNSEFKEYISQDRDVREKCVDWRDKNKCELNANNEGCACDEYDYKLIKIPIIHGYKNGEYFQDFVEIRSTYLAINNETKNIVGVVELEEGPRLRTQLVAVEEGDVKIGMPVEFSFRKISSEGDEGVITYGFKFRPKNYPNHLKKK